MIHDAWLFVKFAFDGQFLFLMFTVSIIEAIWNIALFRYDWSWIPFVDNKGVYSVNEGMYKIRQDPFHVFKGLQTVFLLWMVWIYKNDYFCLSAYENIRINPTGSFEWILSILSLPVFIWLIYYGLGMFTWNYHIFLIRPKYWKQEIWKVFPLVIWTKWIKR